MSQQVQELINKIKSEGIQQAEAKAKDIQLQAQKKAEHIIKEAEQKAKQLTDRAQREIQQAQDAAHMALQQAARDMILQLREEIQQMLKKIIREDIRQALTPEQLAGLLGDVIKKALSQNADIAEVIVALSPADQEKFKKHFLAGLQKEIGKPIRLQAAEDIEAGLTISYDGGKSYFDISDENLVDYISRYMNAEVSALLKETINE